MIEINLQEMLEQLRIGRPIRIMYIVPPGETEGLCTITWHLFRHDQQDNEVPDEVVHMGFSMPVVKIVHDALCKLIRDQVVHDIEQNMDLELRDLFEQVVQNIRSPEPPADDKVH